MLCPSGAVTPWNSPQGVWITWGKKEKRQPLLCRWVGKPAYTCAYISLAIAVCAYIYIFIYLFMYYVFIYLLNSGYDVTLKYTNDITSEYTIQTPYKDTCVCVCVLNMAIKQIGNDWTIRLKLEPFLIIGFTTPRFASKKNRKTRKHVHPTISHLFCNPIQINRLTHYIPVQHHSACLK